MVGSRKGWKWAYIGNYLFQLRPYSYADLILMLSAFKATMLEAVGASLLWFGFLIHLEWQHNDVGRLRWPWAAWLVPWVSSVLIVPPLNCAGFFVLGSVYSLKKRYKYIGIISWIINGAIKGSLAALCGGSTAISVLAVTCIMALRNLAGDIRDAGKDSTEGVQTLPVALGLRRNVPLVYPVCLLATTLLWCYVGQLPGWALAVAISVELATYRLTPR